jgi:hypothetical protein
MEHSDIRSKRTKRTFEKGPLYIIGQCPETHWHSEMPDATNIIRPGHPAYMACSLAA